MNDITAQQVTIESTVRGLALEAASARRKVGMLAERMEAEAKQIRHRLTTTTASLVSSVNTSTAAELAAITWIRSHYMDTPIVSAALQVVLGGVLVFLTGIAIGSS